MTERTILERLNEKQVVCIKQRNDGDFGVMGNYSMILTRAELLQLADEIRELAGEDFDHG